MVNYACGFTQSEKGKYFEWITIQFKLTSSWFPSLIFDVVNVSGTEIFCLFVESFQCSILFLLPSLTSWMPEIFTRMCYQRRFLCQQSLLQYLILFQQSPCQVHIPLLYVPLYLYYISVCLFFFFFWISILFVIVRNSFYQSGLTLNGKITPQKHF